MNDTNLNKKNESGEQKPVENKKPDIVALLNASKPSQIPTLPEVEKRFKVLYGKIHPGKKVDRFYEAEKFHFAKLLQENTQLQGCTNLSLYGCFLDVAVNGLSFDPSFNHLYIVPFNINVGTKQVPKWEKRAKLQISGIGELLLRKMQRQIKYADNPILVYGSDIFKYGTKSGSVFVEHENILPRKDKTIIACYMKIYRIDGSIDYKVITQEDMDRFRAFSKEKDSKAWTDGIGGMWISKCIKHSFKSYPKLRTGKFSELQTETIDTEAEEIKPMLEEGNDTMHIPEVIEYGVDEESGELVETRDEQQQENKFETQKDFKNVTDDNIDDESFVKKGKGKQDTLKFDDENY